MNVSIYCRTPLSCSTSHSGDRLYQSGTLKSTNDNLNVPSYRRKYISNKKPGIKPASHFTERCKSSAAPACRTRSLHYLTPKVKRMIHCILKSDLIYQNIFVAFYNCLDNTFIEIIHFSMEFPLEICNSQAARQ